MGSQEDLHRFAAARGTHGGVLNAHHVPLVALDTPDGKAVGSGDLGQLAGVGSVTSAARQPDVDVDQHFAKSTGGGGLDGRDGVDSEGDAMAGLNQGTEAAGIENLVGEQQIIAEPSRGKALALPDGGAREYTMSSTCLVSEL